MPRSTFRPKVRSSPRRLRCPELRIGIVFDNVIRHLLQVVLIAGLPVHFSHVELVDGGQPDELGEHQRHFADMGAGIGEEGLGGVIASRLEQLGDFRDLAGLVFGVELGDAFAVGNDEDGIVGVAFAQLVHQGIARQSATWPPEIDSFLSRKTLA